MDVLVTKAQERTEDPREESQISKDSNILKQEMNISSNQLCL